MSGFGNGLHEGGKLDCLIHNDIFSIGTVMNEFPKEQSITGLIEEAVGRATQLGIPYDSRISEDFLKAQETLGTIPKVKSQQTLVLSAVRILIARVEKKTIALIIGDEPITGQQMSHLVRIRLICAELINLISSALELIKKPLARPGINAPRVSGAG